ncbi:CDP-glycerol glycerophosphotransferase family protein [Brevibacterium senegalense]|nr:CDP-glycerol glycerophosphotransferase family protein [Brevibacterium senegalense]
MTVRAETSRDVLLGTLWAQHHGEWVQLGSFTKAESPDSALTHYVATIDLHHVAEAVHEWTEDYEALAQERDSEDGGYRFKLFVQVVTTRDRAPRFAKDKDTRGPELQYLLPLGRAKTTELPDFSTIDTPAGSLTPYVNRQGLLSIAVNESIRPYARVHNGHLTVDNGMLTVRGHVMTRNTRVRTGELVLVGRVTDFRRTAPLTISYNESATSARYGLRQYEYEVTYDFHDDVDVIVDDTADLYLELDADGEDDVIRARIGRSPFLVRQQASSSHATTSTKALSITPYYTFKAKNPSLHLEVFDRSVFDYLQNRLRDPRRVGRRQSTKPVWLVGELPYKAQDNGMHFFRYLRDNHPEIDAYYVIRKDSPERRNLEGYTNVIDFRSKEHIDVTLAADKIVGTHHPGFLYPTREPSFEKRLHADNIFLQHGVTAAKWMVPNYGKTAAGFDTDLIMVCSEREKEFFVKDFGYAPAEVAVAGFSRFDALLAGDVEMNPRQLMIMPTWRPWLQDPERFTESDYFDRWSSLLTSDAFKEQVQKYSLEVVFCLHPNMQQFSDHFTGLGARIVYQGDVDVQLLMKQSAVMVTDYSSVAFDFSFLHRPVVYYQFDAQRFAKPHADPLTELPGPVVRTDHGVLDALEQIFEAGARMDDVYRQRADRFIAHRDTHNNERIFAAIRDFKPLFTPLDDLLKSEPATLAGRVLRKNRRYMSVMKRAYKVMRLFPLDTDTIVFESGQAKQYGDSPRAIYEELVRRNDPRRKVWIYNGRLPQRDAHTTVVKRHSPQFFWHLATAKYWINNHNFPHYIHRRKDGVYIQTWHGTPLKRMFLDQDNFFGRDSGYIARVTEASAQWSELVSPSPYATKAMRSSYGYTGRVHEVGYPRNDILSSPDAPTIRESVRQQLGIDPDKSVVLYAPTFRDDQPTTKGRFAFDWPFDLPSFMSSLGDDVVLLVRTHVLISNKLPIPEELTDAVKDVSKYPDIQELFLASDMLVTDYSSSFFDYAILKRPIIFYAFDLENYRDNLRGFYLNYDTDLPGPIVRTEVELASAIDDFREGRMDPEDTVGDFSREYSPNDDGGASGRVIDLLL